MRHTLACGIATIILLAAFASWAQQPSPNADPSATPPEPPTQNQETALPPEKRGFFNALGRWIDKSATGIKDTFGDIGKKTTGTAKDAVDTIVKLPVSGMVDGRERCAVAANGSPDCRSAAETLCKSKGYSTGSSVDVQSAQKCPMRTWLSGRAPAQGECTVETFVTRSMCQ